MMDRQYNYENLLDIVAKLREKDGCPWDQKQTHESLIPNFLEETYEVIDAIENRNVEGIKEELGDVLLQVIFHAQIAKEDKHFTMDEVIDGIAKKLVDRHPHVFANKSVEGSQEVRENWEKIKKKEKNMLTQTQVLESVPKVLPSLMRAYKVQKKAANVGFDWTEYRAARDKVDEELGELEAEIQNDNPEQIQEEFGDVLFSIVNLSRFLKVNPEIALTKSIEKFINRFRYVEQKALAQDLQLEDMTLEEMDELWEDAKKV